MPATWAWAAAKRLTIGSPQRKVILEAEILIYQGKLKIEVVNIAVTEVAMNTAIILEASISPADQEKAVGYLLRHASNHKVSSSFNDEPAHA
jgi:hypothetical protein